MKPIGGETEDNGQMDYQSMLDHGKQLVNIGRDLIIAAKSMGATDVEEMQPPGNTSSDEEVSSQGDSEPDPGDTSDSEDSSDESSAPSDKEKKKLAIIIAIKKRLGKKK